ncbi:MAG: D-alanyl-lipoteichoic acid biosynthesis protein DltD [Spirochaetia bacterium]|nr:D-alanyl-lipoteichoic acid biosynthesis protein DltD [Spirochaetia bacterium]
MKKTNFMLHVVALAIAVIFSAGINKFLEKYNFAYINIYSKEKNTYEDIGKISDFQYLYDLSDKKRSYLKLEKALLSGKITIFGSSELASSLGNNPHIFFNKELGIPVNAIGGGGHQSLIMLAELSSLYNEILLNNARLVFLISPGWFNTEGTNIKRFTDYINAELFYRLYYQSSAPKEFKNYIISNINRRYDTIMDITPLSMAYSFKKNIGSINLAYFFKYLKKNHDIETHDYSVYEGKKIDWEKILENAKIAEINKYTNNDYYIYDDYFTKYMKYERLPKHVRRLPLFNQEYDDFEMLINLLKNFKNRPLFVLWPIHPTAHAKLNRYDEVLNKIRKKLKQENFELLDLWMNEGEIEIGVLTDLMHPGEYGWAKVNKEIYKRFIHNN